MPLIGIFKKKELSAPSGTLLSFCSPNTSPLLFLYPTCSAEDLLQAATFLYTEPDGFAFWSKNNPIDFNEREVVLAWRASFPTQLCRFLHLEEPHPNYSERMYSMRHGAYYSNGYCHNLFLSPTGRSIINTCSLYRCSVKDKKNNTLRTGNMTVCISRLLSDPTRVCSCLNRDPY